LQGGQANQRSVAARRRADQREVDATWSTSRTDGRRRGGGTVDQGGGWSTARGRRRRRSLLAGVPSPIGHESDSALASSPSQRAPAVVPRQRALSLYDQLRHHRRRRASCGPLVGQLSTRSSRPASATSSYNDRAGSASAPVRLQLQTRVKVSERPVRCLVNARWALRINSAASAQLSMGWVDPWVGLGRDFSVFGGLGWVHYSKSTKNSKGLF